MITRNYKVKELTHFKINNFETDAVEYVLKPTDLMLIINYTLVTHDIMLSLCLPSLPDSYLVPVDYVEEFEEMAKSLGINIVP